MNGSSLNLQTGQSGHPLRALVDAFGAEGGRPAVVSVCAGALGERSYRQLHDDICRLASQLQRLNLGTGESVILLAPNGPAWISAYFGTIYAGGIVVPVDEQTPKSVLDHIFGMLCPRYVLTTAAHGARLDTLDAPQPFVKLFIDGDDDEWNLATRAGDDLPDAGAIKGAAVVLFTSGTTGLPKAVPLTADNLMANIRALTSVGLIRANERVLVPLPLFHAYPCTVGMLAVLAARATIVLPEGLTGPQLIEANTRAGVTAMLGVPRLFAVMLDGIDAQLAARRQLLRWIADASLHLSMWLKRRAGVSVGRRLFRSLHRRFGPELRTLACGGASLDAELAHRLEGYGWEVLTGYGLTETSPVLTFNPRGGAVLESVGVPIAGVEIRIDSMAPGESGEILARGDCVFRGYWQDEAANREAFTEDGWFRTGDLGFLDTAGYLHVIGRCKEVLVLADGKNVMPEPLESVFAAGAFIKEIAVMEKGGRLAALVVPDEEAARQHGTVREAAALREELEYISNSLPSYQRLADYRVTRAPLPRTRLGKIERFRLPALFGEAGAAVEAVTEAAPEPGDDTLLKSPPTAEIWAWLARRFPEARLSLDTSPQFDLRIDSLGWASVTLELQERFRVRLDGEAISGIATLRDLLCEIQRHPPESRPQDEMRATEGFDPMRPASAHLRVLDWLLRVIARPIVRIAYRLQVSGVDNLPDKGPFVLVPNHTSYLDPVVLGAALPSRVLSNTYWAGLVARMYSNPINRLISRATRVFPVDPNHSPASGIDEAIRVLRAGKVLVWFPEGRRSPTGAVQSFQPGLGHILEECRTTAIPVAIIGTHDAWPVQRRLPRLRKVRVAIGTPQTASEYVAPETCVDPAEHICAVLQARVARLVSQHS